MNKKILITGAAGFIGSHLVDFLLEKKIALAKLRLLIPQGESLHNLPPKEFEIVWGDIRDKRAVKKAMKNVELVYHLAAKIDFDGKTYAEYRDVNVRGTFNLLHECINKKIKKFVFFSSIAVYGLPASRGEMRNWDESFPALYTNFYGKSKWEAEKLVRKFHQKFNLPYSIIRPASVYGPREQGPTLGLYQAIASGKFMMIGRGKNKMHYVFVRDLVEATYVAGKSRRKSGEYIIAGATPTKFEDVARYVADSIGKKNSFLRLPRSVAMTMAYVLEFVGRMMGIKMPLFPSRVRTMTTSYYFNISKAKKELRYKPKVSFRRGAEITGKWYREHGYL